MEPGQHPTRAESASEARIRGWLEAKLGRVASLVRQGRWRPVWFAEVERAGETLALCVRGDRVDMPLVFPLAHEMRVQALLHERGIPVAKVYGLIEEPLAYAMDRVPGRSDFAGVPDAERDAVVDDYLRVLSRIHALDVKPFAEAGVLRAASPAQSGTFGMSRYERIHRSRKRRPDPFLEFCLSWLRRNPPDSRGRESVIVWDSGQFHHRGGKIEAVLDLELAHIGDPMMDLAAWRMRDTVIPYGDFKRLYARYAELSGREIDLAAIQRHHFAFTLTNQLVFGAAIEDPPPESDLMTNLQWCCETNLFATEALAEILDVELPSVEAPTPRDSRAGAALAHLVRTLAALPGEDAFAQYKLRGAFRLARHLARLDEIGDAASDADLDDLHALLGRRPASWREGAAELERFVLADAAEGRHDVALLQLFHKRNLRAQMLLGPAGSAMARHLKIQTFR